MYTIIFAFWLAEIISTYPKQCKNVNFKLKMNYAFLTHWEWIIMQILEDHMSSLSFPTIKVIVSRKCELSWKLINNVAEIIICIY